MNTIVKKFKYLFLIFIFIFLVVLKTTSEDIITFSENNFNNNRAEKITLKPGEYKVGKDFPEGIYDVNFTKDTTINDIPYRGGETINNLILNKRDFFVIDQNIELEPAQSIYWNERLEPGEYEVSKDMVYKFWVDDSSKSPVTLRIVINGEDVYEIDKKGYENSQKINFKKGDDIVITTYKDTKIKGKKI